MRRAEAAAAVGMKQVFLNDDPSNSAGNKEEKNSKTWKNLLTGDIGYSTITQCDIVR